MTDREFARATDPRNSAWVSANAGSGKTHLLTDRVTRLLLSGAKPERILCLTYTKAAASEMATRLFARLGAWALLPDEKLRGALAEIGETEIGRERLRRARQLFAQALETPGGLKIQTIHSFCQHVLTRFPVEAGVAPRFTVLDERSAGELMATARNKVLENAGRGDEGLENAVSLLATRAADGRFAEILDIAIRQSGRLRSLVERHGGVAGLFARIRISLGIGADEDEASILAGFCTELGGERARCERVAAWLVRGSDTDRKFADCFSRFLAGGMAAEFVDCLRDVFLTQNGVRARLATKALEKAEPALHQYLVELQKRYAAMDERRNAAITVALTEALVTVADSVLRIYDRLKRNRAALDYDDLIAKTRELIKDADSAAWVLYKLDGGLDHILVDEAQDTSPEQWEIIAQLADEFFAGEGARLRERARTIFAVGDEKQSIFSFQGADPEAFGHYLAHFKTGADAAKLPFVEWRPAVSRRSGIAVLEFVDRVFADDGVRDGLTSAPVPVRHEAARPELARIEVWPLVKPPADPEPDPWDAPVDAPPRQSAGAMLAARIAETIARWVKEGVRIPGTDRPVTPGDIMILVRRRNAFTEEMIRQLMERGLPVAGADRMVLMDQIAIADLVALGNFALLPEDDLNLAALLKSPLVGFSEQDLYDLAQPREGTLWHALVARKDERPEFLSAHGFLARALADADFDAPFEFYAHVLGAGVRKQLVARLGSEAADAIDEFLGLALAHESQYPPSLQSFLDWFQQGASEVKRDMERAAGSIRVMTVHGAKGLEADIVIVPDTAQIPDHERRSGILFGEDCVFFGVPKPLETPPITRAKAAAQLREMREYRRLLYVALTRAREWLVLCGYENKMQMPATSWYPHLQHAAETAGRTENLNGETIWVMGAPLANGPAAAAGSRESASTPKFLSEPASAEASPRILRPSDATGGDDFLISPIAEKGPDRFRRGLLIHALLSRLPDIPAQEREATALLYLSRQAVEETEAMAIVTETLSVLNDSRFASLFGPGTRSEVAIAGGVPQIGRFRVSGQIDRLAVTHDSVLVADFKTNRPPPSSIEKTPRLYIAQMALYRAALAQIYPRKRIDCALVWTDGPRLMPIPPAMLDAEIARIARAPGTQDTWA